MSITVAETAGFCFGVSRAIKIINELLNNGEKVYTLGPIIHNPQMVKELEERGVEIVENPGDINTKGKLVIRSHGVPMSVIEELNSLNIDYKDATCPFVSKIHKIVREASKEENIVLIAGDENHPEVIGIRGNCFTQNYVFKDSEELKKILKNCENLTKNKMIIVAQTTFDIVEWKNCLEIVKKVCTNAIIFDTICNATSERQIEAEKISKKSDLMIVIGGKHSSNTLKLYNICKNNCETYWVETSQGLPCNLIKNAKNIGVTAGASTPLSIIKEVISAMAEIKKLNDVKEENFEEMLEESLKSFNTDERVKGVVVGMTPTEVYVDVGRKQAGIVPRNELSFDPNAKVEDLVKIGDEIELLIMRTNDQEGTMLLSKNRIDSLKGWDEIIKAEEEEATLTGVVRNIIKGGLIVTSNGVRVFIPASQATMSRADSLEDLLNKEVSFKLIEVNKNRRRAIGSIRAVLKEEKKKLAEKFWETAEVGKKYTGTVRSLTNYGVFVDLGGIDGMIHISELSWGKIKHPSEIVKVGDVVEVYIKDLDKEKGRIALGYKKTEDNPWEILKKDYSVGQVIDTQIVGITTFGAFAKVVPGVDGLIHISQIADHRIDKPQDVLSVGDNVKAIITDIDYDKKRVSLSIRELLEKEKAESEKAEKTEEKE